MHLSSRTTALHRGQALQATPVARGSGATHGVDARAAARSAPRADPQSTSALQQPSYAPSRSAAPSRRGVCARAELGASSSGSSSSGAKGGRKRQLPIFPLSVVALPHCQVPLMIFEARYRVLFSTLLDSMPGVDEGLVQKDSPFCGSREFGMCFVDQEGNLAAVGSTLRIQDMEPLEDGRLMVNSKGEQRFRVTSVVREKPVLICEIEEMDEPEDSESAEVQTMYMFCT